MAMSDEVRFYLEKESSSFQDRVFRWAHARLVGSQQHMQQRHASWRESETLYRSFREPDQTDKEVRAQSLTEGVQKIVVPYTYATIQSILAWQVDFFTQRKPMIPVEGVGPDDQRPAIIHEHLIEHQMDRMPVRGPLVVLQFLLDAQIYGLGVLMNGWTVREYLGLKRNVKPVLWNGETVGYDDNLEEEDIVDFEGNQATNVQPFDWYPDPRLPVARFQEGEFCGHRTLRSDTDCRVKEKEGLFAGTQWIPNNREGSTRALWGGAMSESQLGRTLGMQEAGSLTGPSLTGQVDEDGKPYRTLDHLWALVPPNVLQLEGLNPDGLPRMWVITIANNARVIRVEPANLPGRRFPFAAMEVNYNLHSPMNPGLVEIMRGPQYHLSWLINSRSANVRRSMNYELLYDPSLVEESDLTSPNASGLIRLKEEAFHSGADLSQIVKQLPVTDVTSGHMADARSWADMIEQITGANRMIQGLSNTGRRAATEVQASLGLAAGRMKLIAMTAASQGLIDWAEQMVANNAAFLSERLTVKLRDPYAEILKMDYLEVTPDQLQGFFRIPLLEQGIPTDKVFHANTLREMLQLYMQSPAAAAMAQRINGSEIFIQLLRVLGFRNLRDFILSDEQMAAMQPQAMPAEITAQPDEQVARQVERGNLVPTDGARPPQATMPNAGGAGAGMSM